jgi:DNA-binding transcriptional LysR family regulator
MVARFLTLYPGITLEIAAEDRFVDVLAAGFDAGVRYGESLERDMIAIPIGPRRQRFVAAAAPSYIAARGAPKEPRDLLDHACIRHRFAHGVLATWEFERHGETVRVNPSGPLIASAMDIQLAAAKAGLGIICTFEDYLRAALQEGALVAVLEDWPQEFPGPFLYYANRAHMPAPLRAFVDFIRADGVEDAR